MAIKTSIFVRENALTKEKVASARIVDLQEMNFSEFCHEMANDSTVSPADVAAVMMQFEQKIPTLLAHGYKVVISPDGMTIRPSVSGSLTQEQLKAKLQARADKGEEVDVNRAIAASDLTVNDLTLGFNVDFTKKFKQLFNANAKLKRVSGSAADAPADGSTDSKPSVKPGGSEAGGGGNIDA